jgi:hypothetical protein
MVEECASKCTGQIPPHLNFCTPEQNLRLKTERKTSIKKENKTSHNAKSQAINTFQDSRSMTIMKNII